MNIQETLLNRALIMLLQEMLIINGLTHNPNMCFVSWLFQDVILGVVLCCIVSITRKSIPVKSAHERHLVTFYYKQFICSDHCVLGCNTIQFFSFLWKMLPLFSVLKICSFYLICPFHFLQQHISCCLSSCN